MRLEGKVQLDGRQQLRVATAEGHLSGIKFENTDLGFRVNFGIGFGLKAGKCLLS